MKRAPVFFLACAVAAAAAWPAPAAAQEMQRLPGQPGPGLGGEPWRATQAEPSGSVAPRRGAAPAGVPYPGAAQSPSQPVSQPVVSPSQPVSQPAGSAPYTGGGSSPRSTPVVQPKPSPSQPVSSPPLSPGGSQPPYAGKPPRVTPVAPPGWPLTRPPNPVIVRPSRPPWDDPHGGRGRGRDDDDHRRRHRDRPPRYLPLVIFGGAFFGDHYDRDRWRDRLLWEDAVTLYDEEGWVEFTLDCGARGEKLWIELRDGRGRIDWAEVVFDDGDAQVVDFSDRSLGPGLYRLLELRGARRVDYVRMVAQAATREVRLILRLER